MAKVAPAVGSNRRATSTSATFAQDSRSSRLTWDGSEMREATALTAKEHSGEVFGHQVVHRPRPSGGGERPGDARSPEIGLLAHSPSRHPLHRAAPSARGEDLTTCAPRLEGSSPGAEGLSATNTQAAPAVCDGSGRRWGRGLPAPVDVAVARAGVPGPAAVQGGGEAVPHRHRQDPVAGAHRARDRGGPRPAAHPRGRARRRHRVDRRASWVWTPTPRCARSPTPPRRRGTTCSASTTRPCSCSSPSCAACPTATAA